jgi:trk system potassium uptake protein
MVFSKFAVIGIGRYGITIAKSLAQKGAQVFAFDNKEDRIEVIKDDVAFAVTMDTTDVKSLMSQNITEMDAVVIAIGENFEATVLTAVHLMDLGVKRILVRASGAHQKLILEKIGIKEILTPEDELASAVRERLLNPSILSFLQLPDDYEVAEILAPKGVINRTIKDIQFRNKYHLTLITIKRAYEVTAKGVCQVEEHILGVPASDAVVEESDTLVVFGTGINVSRFIEINE